MKEVELRDWAEFKEYASDNFSGRNGFIFRGQADRDWKLESTLTRLGQRVSGDLKPELLSGAQLKNFKMRIRGLRGNNPQPLDENGLWSLGQHYGLCTPLLDWTESAYIAAYFAFENSDSCKSGWRTIYALNRVGLNSKKAKSKNDDLEFLEPLQDDNKRITAQAGLFTKIPTGIDFETWLRERNLEDNLVKMNIENENRLEIINDLKLMNITGASIYPDLHGAATYSNMFLETLSDNHESNKSFKKLMKEIFD